MIVPGHILQVCPAIVKGVFVDVMTDLIVWSFSDNTMHTNENLFAVHVRGQDSVHSVKAFFREPVIFVELVV